MYKIGDLAKEFDVTLRTLRFYEDKGLIKPQRVGTTRLYSDNDREKLRVALFCKRIGLSLVEIRDVLKLQSENYSALHPELRQIFTRRLSALEVQREETEQTIADLRSKIAEMDTTAQH